MRFDPKLPHDAPPRTIPSSVTPEASESSAVGDDFLEDQETTLSAETIRAALQRAAHSMTGAEERWSALRRVGADDATLESRLAFEFGSYGGCSSPVWHEHYGGKNPCLSVGWSPRSIRLSGPHLLRLARSVLEISSPIDALQGRLF
jgi:hypothetical protein